MRARCPVAYSEYLNWSLFKHEDVVRVLNDPQSFSNVVSSYLSVPNGMDPPEHTEYRQIIETYFSPQRMETFAPVCRNIANNLVKELPKGGETELTAVLAQPFALKIQCAFLGWPASLHEPLRHWIRKNHAATLRKDKAAMDDVALEFDGYIKGLLDVRRKAGVNAPDDITASLLGEKVGKRQLDDEEIVSILRNWTVGELGTIAACVGILAHYLAEHAEIQKLLREQMSLLPIAIDEILRIHAPLIANRRMITKPVEIGGQKLEVGDRITLLWASANRDEAIFGDPDEFRLDRDQKKNLLYGAGIHICPGAPLARLELCSVMEALLSHTTRIALVPGNAPVNAIYPGSGFSSLPLWIQ
ncbi:Cytochrome P450 [Georgfuchsia toluolica]|uniref:Cytochrome P450 n=2 Tax=Georgfuchsia toluolica TaxID=424218 RepID=A0A916J4Q1_9PROT|nr:Cytochrome P450 [Georgfuchsia toluolica]